MPDSITLFEAAAPESRRRLVATTLGRDSAGNLYVSANACGSSVRLAGRLAGVNRLAERPGELVELVPVSWLLGHKPEFARQLRAWADKATKQQP